MVMITKSRMITDWVHPTMQCNLGYALYRWENEGGAVPSTRTFLVTQRPTAPLAGSPRYLNEIGVHEIRIGAAEFHCIGALPPQDHPHIYLNMEGRKDTMCPYCSTIYIYDARLRADETEPAGCFYAPAASKMTSEQH
jgi:uncharacterized Zn-finger protein